MPVPRRPLRALAGSSSSVVAFEIGADDYVCKPFDEQELIAQHAQAIFREAA